MEQQMTLEIVNKNAAGIDIGSRSHWVAVGQKKNLTLKNLAYIMKIYTL